MDGEKISSQLPTYAESDGRGLASPGNAMAALMIAVIWFKFHTFDEAILPRHTLTLITGTGALGALLLLFMPALLLPRRARGAALVALDSLLSLLLLADLLYVRFYADLFSLRNIGLSSYAWEIASSIAGLARARDALYFADIPVFALLARFIRDKNGWGRLTPVRAASVCAVMLMGASGLAWKIYDYDGAVPGAIRSLWDRPSVATSTGTLVYHAADVLNIIDDAVSRKSYTESDARSLWEWLVSRDAKRDEPGDTYGAGRGKNLVMIQVESLQSFVVGLKVGNVEVTPNINRLVRESVYFPSVYSQTAAGNSSDAELMAHASLYPTAKGAAFMRFARNRFVSLGTELSSMGYSTVALHGDRPGFWNRNHMYPSLGFDRYVSIKDFRLDESIGLGLSDRSFFEQSMAFIRTTDGESGPFFAFLVTLTSHYPFNFKSLMTQTADLPLGEAEGTLPGDYVLSISYVDAQIGKFIDMLRDEELLDESVVVLYGDHAAIPRGDHGILSLLLGRDLSSPAAWRAIQSVPLVVRLPRGEFRGERNVTAGQIDIAPTVASVMGFKMPTAMGSNLLDPGLDERAKLVVFRNGSFIRDGIWVEPGRGTAYNMRTSEAAGYSDEMARCAAEAAAQLRFSDMMLEGDMASSLEQFKLRAENK